MALPLAFLDLFSGPEMALIAFAALLLFGGKGMPEFARGFGKVMKELRKATNEVEREFKRVMDEVENPIAEVTGRTPAPTISRPALTQPAHLEPLEEPALPAEEHPGAEPSRESSPDDSEPLIDI